jgi:hypothetical protein
MTSFTETPRLPEGIELFYTDSGAPNAVHCTTHVVLHGSGFSGGKWHETLK